jgi:hypothetical protein
MSVAMLLFLFILSVTVVVPHALDFKAAKRKKFESVTGTVARYKKVNHGGEPPTTSFYPIIKDSITGKELILKVNGAEINRRYTFIYLKHTKLALIKSTVD